MSDFVRYIGIPWEKGGEGPDSFNCGTFVRHIQREHFGREIPVSFVDEDDLAAVTHGLVSGLKVGLLKGWKRVSAPAHGDVVFLANAENPTHVGTWVDIDGGGVLHCVRGAGVVFSSKDSLRLSGWANMRFYRK